MTTLAVNGKSFCVPSKGGAVRVALSLIKHLSMCDSVSRIIVYIPNIEPDAYLSRLSSDRLIIKSEKTSVYGSRLARNLWEQIVLPSRVRDDECDLILNLTNTSSVFFARSIPQIILLHDAGFLNTEWFKVTFSFYQRFVTERASRCGNVCFTTVSKATSCEIVSAFEHIQSVEVIYNAVDLLPIDSVRLPLSQQKYILFVGNLNPRKNLSGLISAFTLFRRDFPEFKLYVIGAYKDVFHSRETGLADDSIEFLGYVDGDSKWEYIRNAQMLVLPSFLESFGLPVLEALSVKTPVVVSDIACFRELYGDVAQFCDPRSGRDICAAMRRVLDIDYHMWSDLAQELTVRFSWDQAAFQYAQLIEHRLGKRDEASE
jgi:glycosyltransferase involved in cell wall biosynthesis